MAYEKDQPVRFQREKGARIMDATVRRDDGKTVELIVHGYGFVTAQPEQIRAK
jgi:hypothetical protein